MLTGFRALPASPLRYFGDSRCRSIWQWQLVTALTIVAIGVGVAMLTPARFTDWHFSLGVALLMLVTVAALAVPWHRIGKSVVLVLPVLDALFIFLMAWDHATAIAFLWVFPIAWVGTYFSSAVLIGMLCLVAVLRTLNLLIAGITPDTTINAVMLMITLGFVGVIMAVGAQRNRSSRRLLSGQSDRLLQALQRVNDQKARNIRLLNSLDIGIARVSAAGLVEISNTAFRALLSLGSAHLQLARPAEYRTRRGAPIPTDQTSIARAARGERIQGEIVWVFGLDGNWRAVRVFTRTIENSIVTGDGLLLILEDVTGEADPVAGENARRRTISHELRNPLTAILGHIDLLLERPDLPDGAYEQLAVVERAGARMRRLIDDALSSPGTRDDEAVEFDLAEIARASLEAFAPTADSSGITLDADLSDGLEVRGDAFRIRQVVDNIVGNAIKYVQRGGRVGVRGSRGDGEVSLVIADNGIGISEQDLPRIFEREFRTRLAHERGIPGTGLGLSISREIVTTEGGRFEVESELGRGTAVTIVLPMAPSAPTKGRPSPEGHSA